MAMISPSILSADFCRLADECRLVLEAGAQMLHFDVMDGHFVPNISFGVPVLASLHNGIPSAFFDVHLMISHPLAYVEPFAKAGADLIMAGHIAAPEVTGEDTPASLSPQLMGSIRTGLGFSGAIVTDSLAMEGITGLYSAGEAAVLAVQAGADILLMPNGLAEAFDAVVAAVEEGTIPESRIDESAARVLALKEKRGLI